MPISASEFGAIIAHCLTEFEQHASNCLVEDAERAKEILLEHLDSDEIEPRRKDDPVVANLYKAAIKLLERG